MFAMSPRATTTEQKLPNLWSGLKPSTISMPEPMDHADAYSGWEWTPEARPIPATKAMVKEVVRPRKVRVKRVGREVFVG